MMDNKTIKDEATNLLRKERDRERERQREGE